MIEEKITKEELISFLNDLRSQDKLEMNEFSSLAE